jgi:hypothetical protein
LPLNSVRGLRAKAESDSAYGLRVADLRMTPVSAAGLRVADPGRDLHGNLKFNLPVDLKLASPAQAALYVGLGHWAPSPSESPADSDSDSDRRSTVPMTDGTVDARTGKNFNFSERP